MKRHCVLRICKQFGQKVSPGDHFTRIQMKIRQTDECTSHHLPLSLQLLSEVRMSWDGCFSEGNRLPSATASSPSPVHRSWASIQKTKVTIWEFMKVSRSDALLNGVNGQLVCAWGGRQHFSGSISTLYAAIWRWLSHLHHCHLGEIKKNKSLVHSCR